MLLAAAPPISQSATVTFTSTTTRSSGLCGLLAGARPGDDAGQRERDRTAREIEEGEKTGRVGTRTR